MIAIEIERVFTKLFAPQKAVLQRGYRLNKVVQMYLEHKEL